MWYSQAAVKRGVSRTLVICWDFPPATGGIQHYLEGMLTCLPSPRIEVVAPAWSADRVYKPPCRLHSCAPTLGDVWRAARQALHGSRFDSLLAAHLRVAPVALALGRCNRIPYDCLAYGMEIGRGRWARLKDAVLRRARRVITISSFSARLLVSRGVAPRRIRVVHPRIGAAARLEEEQVLSVLEGLGIAGKRIVLTVGRMDRREQYKGHDLLVESFGQLVAEFGDLVLVVVGGGDDAGRLRALASDALHTEHVLFTGPVDGDTLAALYQGCEVFAMPSREIRDRDGLKFEGFGIVFLEAAARGRPVVGGDSGGIPDAVDDGTTGLLVDPDDPAALTRALRAILESPDLAARLGEAGRRRVLEHFLWDGLDLGGVVLDGHRRHLRNPRIRADGRERTETSFYERHYASETPPAGNLQKDPFGLEILRSVEPLAGAAVLDAGCGDGELADALAQRGARVYSLDLSRNALSHTRRRNPGVRPVQASLHALPFADACFDRVVGNLILHHTDMTRSVPEIRRVLAPGGLAVFSENFDFNPLLRLARKHLVGRFGIARLGTPSEKPLEDADMVLLRRHFSCVEISVPRTLCFQLFDRQVFGYRNRLVNRVCIALDRILHRVPFMRRLSYRQNLILSSCARP